MTMKLPKLDPKLLRDINKYYDITRLQTCIKFEYTGKIKTSHSGPIRIWFEAGYTEHHFDAHVHFHDFGMSGRTIQGHIWLGEYRRLSKAIEHGFLRTNQLAALLVVVPHHGRRL